MSDQLNKIERSLGIIEGKIDGINKRLDTSNGRIQKGEDRLNCIETEQDKMKGSTRTALWVWGTVLTLIGLAIAYFK